MSIEELASLCHTFREENQQAAASSGKLGTHTIKKTESGYHLKIGSENYSPEKLQTLFSGNKANFELLTPEQLGKTLEATKKIRDLTHKAYDNASLFQKFLGFFGYGETVSLNNLDKQLAKDEKTIEHAILKQALMTADNDVINASIGREWDQSLKAFWNEALSLVGNENAEDFVKRLPVMDKKESRAQAEKIFDTMVEEERAQGKDASGLLSSKNLYISRLAEAINNYKDNFSLKNLK